MEFEHIGPDGQCKCVDVHISCINIENCIDQAANGYKFKLDGKRIELAQVKQLVGYTREPANPPASEPTTRKIRSIFCLNNGKLYKNMSEAGKDLGLDPATISYSLKVGRPMKGYEFKFVDDANTTSTPDARPCAPGVSADKATTSVSYKPSSASAAGKQPRSFADLAKHVEGR